ncbi:hypothetical protein O1Q96_04350 [Streptomyces sp. Qhu-G9]|uniref:YqeB family protein n=1 Tax=Streptomyces sp. Qhu-G9 TaxID=3452799 RepID=UPI0022ABFDBC|nr:hypothetical protein [Streptomyces aurantiacus]WAU79049.1 hypothetical protein O1Q96_04350 [Streptomyces aurantiacus]
MSGGRTTGAERGSGNVDMEKRPEPGTRARADDATVLAEPVWAIMLICVLGTGVVGWLTTVLADWLPKLRWAPLKGPAKLLNSIPEPGLSIGAVAVGLLLGVLIGFGAVHDSLTVRVSDSRVVLAVRDAEQEFARDGITLVHRDGKQLVLLGPDGEELAREKSGLSWRGLADAFTAHGYRWADRPQRLRAG